MSSVTWKPLTDWAWYGYVDGELKAHVAAFTTRGGYATAGLIVADDDPDSLIGLKRVEIGEYANMDDAKRAAEKALGNE